MSTKIARAAIHASAQTSFHPAQANENTRDGWDAEKYIKKNEDASHHYDITRKNLNFLVTSEGIKPLDATGANKLYTRYLDRLDELGFKAYNPDAPNQPNSYIDWVFSGDHEAMIKMAFGRQDVDFDLKRSNAHVRRMPRIENFARDVYRFACKRFGAENVIGVECHLDETTPHIHINMIPVALRQQRGRASYIYRHKNDPTKTITSKEYKNLSKEARKEWEKGEAVERSQKFCVSFSGLVGSSKTERGKWLRQFHTDFFNEVGCRYGLERGRMKESLSAEELMNYGHKTAAELEAERIAQIKEAQQLDKDIARRRVELRNIQNQTEKASELLNDKNREISDAREILINVLEEKSGAIKDLETTEKIGEVQKTSLENKLASLEQFANAAAINKEELKYNHFNIAAAEKTFLNNILSELSVPVGTFQTANNWSKERVMNIKNLFVKFKSDVESSVGNTNESLDKSINKIYSYYMQQLAAAKNATDKDYVKEEANTLYALLKAMRREDLNEHISNGADAITIGKILRNNYKQQIKSIAEYMAVVSNRHKSPDEIIQLARQWEAWKNRNQYLFDAEGNFAKAMREAGRSLEDKVYDGKDGLLDAFNRAVEVAKKNSRSPLVWGKKDAANIALGIELVADPVFNHRQSEFARNVMDDIINKSEVVVSEKNRKQQESNVFNSRLFKESINVIVARTSNPQAHSFSLEQTALIATTLGLFAHDRREIAAEKMMEMAKAEATCNSGWFDETEEEMTNILGNIAGLVALLAMPQGSGISSGGGGGGGNELPWRDRDEDWWAKFEAILSKGAKPKSKFKR